MYKTGNFLFSHWNPVSLRKEGLKSLFHQIQGSGHKDSELRYHLSPWYSCPYSIFAVDKNKIQ